MSNKLMALRSDGYLSEPAFAADRPTHYDALIAPEDDKIWFLYANRRYAIPFGWFANPVPSTTSTAWAVMLHFGHNPLTASFSYNANFNSDGEIPEQGEH
jgi:hypothetical protein